MNFNNHLVRSDLQQYIEKVFGNNHLITNVTKMHGGTEKIVYKIDCSNGFSCVLYLWDLTMNFSKDEVVRQKIAELAIVEERHRIARNLHDTLGQKLSMIGLKSELSSKLIDKDPIKAKKELIDIQMTSRHALKEVREIISNMKHDSLIEELQTVEDILDMADIESHTDIEVDIQEIPVLIENILSMCLKESINNVVKHSNASHCSIQLAETKGDISLKILDDGHSDKVGFIYGNGLDSMKERLSFINGELKPHRSHEGFEINIAVPKY